MVFGYDSPGYRNPQTLAPSRTFWRFIIPALIIFMALPIFTAQAQGTAFSELTAPDTTKFPVLTTYLDAFDDQGNFLNQLTSGDVTILENGQQIKPDKLELLNPPVSFVVAINSDPVLATRDGFGVSRYDKIKAALDSWATIRPVDSQDKLALVWNGGVIASGLTTADWKTRFDAFDPAPRTSASSLAALAFALDASQEAETSPGIKKTILLISGHLGLKDQAGLNDLIARAKQARVRVFVWIVDSKAFQDNPGAVVLQNLAESTSGRYATFTGVETLPTPEQWLATLRNVYQVTFTSQIRAGGQHGLSAQVNFGGLALTSPAVNFALDVQPPNAALLSPPIQIVRQNPQSQFDLDGRRTLRRSASARTAKPCGPDRRRYDQARQRR